MIDGGAGFDVVLGTSPSPFSAYWAAGLAKRNKLPFALEIRDLRPLSLRDVAGWKWWHPGWIIFRRLELAIYKNADVLFTLLPNAHAWYTASGVAKDNIIVIPNGVDANSTPDPTPIPDNDPVDDAEAGLTVPPQDPEELAKANTVLSKHSTADLAAMGARGLDYVLRNHEWTALAVRFEGAISGLVH